MSFNPCLTTSETHAEILRRHMQETVEQNSNECYSHAIVSKPNGQSYGKDGHVPSDHFVFFYYNDGTVRQFHASRSGESIWTEVQ